MAPAINMKGMRALITGGLGMLGSTVASQCIRMGAKITILDALFPLYGGNQANLLKNKKDVEILIADIRDEAAINYCVNNKDIIFNFAGQVSYHDSMADPFTDLDINCRGHLIILEACKRLKKKPVVVFSSSRMVYGKINENPVNENHPTNPLMIYGVHKLVGEKYHYMYYRDYGVPCVICRIANPYGPRQQMRHSKYGIVNWFIRLCMSGEELTVFGDGSQIRDYVYVDDIADALIATSLCEKCIGQVYNLGSGQGRSFMDMARSVIQAVGLGSIKSVPWPKDYENIETGDYVSDISKLMHDTGFIPKIDFAEGVRRTLSYYQQNKQYYWED